MPIAYQIDKSLALMTTVWDGPITAADWREHLRETFAVDGPSPVAYLAELGIRACPGEELRATISN